MLELIKQPWEWYIAGPMIALIMVLLMYFGKSFGFSSNLRTICSALGAGKKVAFFNFDWKTQRWNLAFLLGSVLGGFIGSRYLSNEQPLQLSTKTIKDLEKLNIPFDGKMQPEVLFGIENLANFKNIVLLVVGGLLIGFGTRWAGGCTSGHAISGLSNLQKPSLIAVIGFFVGGLVMTHLLLPIIF